MDEQKFLKGVPPIQQVMFAIEMYCDRFDKTDEYRDWLLSVVKDLEQKANKSS